MSLRSKRPQRIGELLLTRGWLAPGQLRAVLAEQRKSREALGCLLLRKGLINPQQLEQVLTQCLLQRGRGPKRRLGQ
ncbi:MAG: hypothetical protein ACAI44_33065, partial [Candidatus Sericytochromatia bacterium]